MAILINFLLTVFVLDAILLIFIVLMQRPKSEGLGAAFGGGMTENLFGAQTTNVLANFTRWLGGIFFALALLLSVLYAKQSTQKSAIQAQVLRNAKPIASPAPAASVSPMVAPAATPVPSAAASPVMTPTGAVSPRAQAPSAPVSMPKPSPAKR